MRKWLLQQRLRRERHAAAIRIRLSLWAIEVAIPSTVIAWAICEFLNRG